MFIRIHSLKFQTITLTFFVSCGQTIYICVIDYALFETISATEILSTSRLEV